MAQIDYSLHIDRTLAELRHESVPPRHRPSDVLSVQNNILTDQLFYSLIAATRAAKELSELGRDAFSDLVRATRRANYYQLLALIGAVGHIGTNVGPEATDVLLEFLSYRDDDIKRAAVEALARCGDPAVASRIEPLCNAEDNLLRSRALYAMAVMSPEFEERLGYLERSLADGDSRALKQLLDGPAEDIPWGNLFMLLDSPNVEVRNTVLRHVTKKRRIPKDVAIGLVNDHHVPVRLGAVRELARHDDADLVGTMLRALQDPVKSVARTAQRWLGPHSRSIRTELAALLDCGSSLSRQMALDLIAQEMDEKLLDKVGGLLALRSSKDMRLAVLRILKKYADHPDARRSIVKALTDQTEEVRQSAFKALLPSIGDSDLEDLATHLGSLSGSDASLDKTVELVQAVATPAAIDVLRANLSHPGQYARHAVIRAIDTLNAFDTLDELREAVARDPTRLHQATLERFEQVDRTRHTLSQRLGAETAKELVERLHDTQPTKRRQALAMVAELDEIECCRAIVEGRLFDADMAVRADAAELLKKLASEELVSQLRDKLKGTREDAHRALEALSILGDKEIAEDVAALLSHYDPEVKQQAARTLEALGASEYASDAEYQVRRVGILKILRDQKRSPEQKYKDWKKDLETVLRIATDFATKESPQVTKVLLENGWQPVTPAQTAAVLLIEQEPDWNRFPEEAVSEMEPFFTSEWDQRANGIAEALLDRWPDACKAHVMQGFRSTSFGTGARMLGMAAERNLFAAEELEQWLHSPELPLQTSAIRLLGKTRGARYVARFLDMLPNALEDDNAGLVSSLLLALGDLGDRHALPAIAPLLEESADPRGRWAYSAINAVAEIGGEEGTRLLLYAMRRAHFSARGAAAKALAAADWQPEDEPDRARFALHMRRFADIKTFTNDMLPIVADYARAGDRVPFEIMEYVCRFETPEAIDTIVHGNWDYFSPAQEKIIGAYLTSNSELAAPVLIETLNKKLDKVVGHEPSHWRVGDIRRILGWLITLKHKETIDVLMRTLAHEGLPRDVKSRAAQALGRLRHAPAVPHVIRLLSDIDDRAAKRALAETLMRLGDPVALTVLHEERSKTDYSPLVKMLDKAIAKLEKG